MSYLIKELPVDERPRERFKKYGVEALSNEELLSILLRTDTSNKSVKDVSIDMLRKIKMNDLVNDLMEERYISGSTTKPSTPDVGATESADSEIQQTYYRPSFIVLFPNGSYEYLAKASTYEIAATQSGDWKNTPVGTKLLETVLTVKGYDLPTADKVDTLVKDSNYFNGVLNNWKVFYDQGYLATKNSALFYQTLLFLGIYAILVLFMGLMVFLLTRGKRNSFNYLTFWACEKIAMWAAVSPGLLSLILGFMLPSYAVMFFIILMGLRTMWLSMKQLRPSYN
jgi:hypothetical protein